MFMTDTISRLDTLARRIQGIIAHATDPDPPITRTEAYDQIVEEMELAGYGAPILEGEFTVSDLSELRRQASN